MNASLGPRGPARVLVVGYGNTLRTDDGVGWHAARLLAGDARLAGAVVLAEHQLAPELALDLSLASLVILLDASAETPAGTVTVRRIAEPGGLTPSGEIRPGDPGGTPGPTSHHVHPELLLSLALELYGWAPEAVVVSVGIADMSPGDRLTPSVEAALPAVADAVARLVADHEGRATRKARASA
ncbi:MAG TPA: hydrogenase maturation protease [Patescibacteria group bacterium]|nr:hydrogenase maturation protease [Patescibacteria group bacterium]